MPETYDILIWIGEQYYTIKEFIDEATKIGVSRRLRAVPEHFEIGKNKVFLASKNTDPETHQPNPVIFGYFVPKRFEIVVKDPEKKKIIHQKHQILYCVPAGPQRQCGTRKEGAVYVVADTDFDAIIEEGLYDAVDIIGPIALLKEWIPLKETKFFRGFKYVHGDKILAHAPEHEWEVEIMPEKKPTKEEIIKEVFGNRTVMRLEDFLRECNNRKQLIAGDRGWIRKAKRLGYSVDKEEGIITAPLEE
ncbi:MAG: hypothetical protein ACTSUO_06035 [Candidatus Thorarchaeota archaeon]